MSFAIVTDIEGTTSSIDFVHRVLFPYSAQAMPQFVREHLHDQAVAPWLAQVAAESGVDTQDSEGLTAVLLSWIAEDRKHTALKVLQGLIWQAGYADTRFRAHVYTDVPPALRQWHAQGFDLYVYSSGSVAAQQQFFAHTESGDLLWLFRGHFDTTSGAKREVESYQRIAATIGIDPAGLLFLSDIVAELDAARAAGWHTILLWRDRDDTPADVDGHRCVSSFAQIDPRAALGVGP